MQILIAPNSFKNSLSAKLVAEAISKGLLRSRLECTTDCFPVGDGGDGTAVLIVDRMVGRIVNTKVHDPLGREISATFGLVDEDKTAVIELADASGIRLLQPTEYDPLHCTTFGTGELIRSSLQTGVEKIIICVGGSATIDGGTGILRALGIKFYDDNENELCQMPGILTNLKRIDESGLEKQLLQTEVVVLCDVENVLLGVNGAAKIFGPQKGANQEQVNQLESALAKWNEIVQMKKGEDMSLITHGGAAGGVAAGLQTFLGAKLVKGINYFLELVGFREALKKANIVITGEGSIDEQTLNGKAPLGVAKLAKEAGLPVVAVAGQVPQYEIKQLREYFDVILPINHEAVDLLNAIKYTYDNLLRTGQELGNLLALEEIIKNKEGEG